jgi:hypothetical protein
LSCNSIEIQITAKRIHSIFSFARFSKQKYKHNNKNTTMIITKDHFRFYHLITILKDWGANRKWSNALQSVIILNKEGTETGLLKSILAALSSFSFSLSAAFLGSSFLAGAGAGVAWGTALAAGVGAAG